MFCFPLVFIAAFPSSFSVSHVCSACVHCECLPYTSCIHFTANYCGIAAVLALLPRDRHVQTQRGVGRLRERGGRSQRVGGRGINTPCVLLSSLTTSLTHHVSVPRRCCSTDNCMEWKSYNAKAGSLVTDFCSVPGQMCTPDGHLLRLDLRGANLGCTFPATDFAAFQWLSTLNLGRNPNLLVRSRARQ
jgi:hypothetical protein